MELCFEPKIEQTMGYLSSSNIKEENNSENTYLDYITKKEEDIPEARIDYSPGFAFVRQQDTVNVRFEQLFRSLSQYLENFVEVEDFEIPSSFQKDKEIQKKVLDAKVYFRKWGRDLIKSLTEDIIKKEAHHTFPDIFFVQTVEATKRRIFSSYKHLKKHFVDMLVQTKKIDDSKTEGSKPKKVIRKNKHEFPHEAQNLLRLWFIAHAQDPYPSHEEKIELAKKGGISMKQLDNWFTNTRGRIWKQAQKLEPTFQKQIAQTLLYKTENFLKIPSSV